MKIAIIRLSAMGDIIMTSAFLGGLREVARDYSIEFFIDSAFSGIIEHSPCIRKIHALPFKKMLKSIGGIMDIREYCKKCGKYEFVIDAQGLLKSAMVGKFLDSNNFIGFDSSSIREKIASFFYNKKVNISYNENVLKRNFKVIFEYLNFHDMDKVLNLKETSLGINFLKIHEDLDILVKNQAQVDSEKILFVLESSNPLKQYPIEKYLQLAKMLRKFLKNLHIYLIYYNDEQNANKLSKMLTAEKLPHTTLPKMNLNEVKYCITQMNCVIGGDTGITHLAWIFNIPSITLYGDTNELKHSYRRVLLGGSFVVSKNKNYEIHSIPADEIFKKYKSEIYKEK